jgi:hypothetical protein
LHQNLHEITLPKTNQQIIQSRIEQINAGKKKKKLNCELTYRGASGPSMLPILAQNAGKL